MAQEPATEGTFLLIERYRRGDRVALEALFARYYERVERIVRVRTGPALLSKIGLEDIVQEALLEAFRSIDQYETREDARFVDWLSKIVQSKIANLADHWTAEKRSRAREVRLDDLRGKSEGSTVGWDMVAETTGAPEKASRRELAGIVDDCLRELSDAHREVILLREYAGGPWDWIAPQVGSNSAHAAEQLYQRARSKLKERVQARIRA